MKRLLLVPLLLTLLVGCSSKDKTFIERRDDCADAYARAISPNQFIKKYKIGLTDKEVSRNQEIQYKAIDKFCQFYKSGTFPQ